MKYVLVGLLSAGAAFSQAAGGRPFRVEELKTLPGFEVSVFARVSGGPRLMTVGPNGVLYVAVRGGGRVVAIPEQDRVVNVVTSLNGPHNAEFRGTDLYVAVNNGVIRFRDAITDDLIVQSRAERILSVPTSRNGHITRTLGFAPSGGLFVTIGSTCNFCVEGDDRYAAIMRFDDDGTNGRVYARGLRNSVDFDWHPVTGELWALDHGGDGLGDNEPPEEINVIHDGGDYGWPDCIADKREARTPNGSTWGLQARPGRCGDTLGPEFQMQAHSAPLGLSFYISELFPASWKNDALVGFHGSWNRSRPTGYKILRVRASSGRATGSEDFLWGFLDEDARTTSGRPVHAITGADGAVYVSDDMTGNIYRVGYTGPRISPGGAVHVGDRIYELYGRDLLNEGGTVSVFANGLTAELLYAGRDQVSFVLPEGLTGEVTLRLENEKAADELAIQVE